LLRVALLVEKLIPRSETVVELDLETGRPRRGAVTQVRTAGSASVEMAREMAPHFDVLFNAILHDQPHDTGSQRM